MVMERERNKFANEPKCSIKRLKSGYTIWMSISRLDTLNETVEIKKMEEKGNNDIKRSRKK